ncbi:TlpA family protein disulfide reductase [Paenibacillus caui]|uniref:TlpA family protein disulfide reductase n=1 Tax=Paenibacillus caui TaxID=2873927 RepID=UPI001F439D31|nr:TlpA disulfide reductase family protein [Paenibacillus caui]
MKLNRKRLCRTGFAITVAAALMTGIIDHALPLRQNYAHASSSRSSLTLTKEQAHSELSAFAGLLAAGRTVKPGEAAPSFKLEGLDGKVYQVGGERDKALLLNFWASWCEPCRLEAPDLEKLAAKYKGKLDLYGVNVTAYDDQTSVKSFVKQYGLHFPILLDTSERVFEQYNGAAFPTQVLIDRSGVVRDIVIGLLPPEQLEDKVRKLIAD